jgi:hypothetical protein
VFASPTGSNPTFGEGLGRLMIGGTLGGLGLITVLVGGIMAATHSGELQVNQSAASSAGPRRVMVREPEATTRAAAQLPALPSLRFSF